MHACIYLLASFLLHGRGDVNVLLNYTLCFPWDSKPEHLITQTERPAPLEAKWTSTLSHSRFSCGEPLWAGVKMSSRQGDIPGNFWFGKFLLTRDNVWNDCWFCGDIRNCFLMQNKNIVLTFRPSALESGTSSGFFGALSSPIGMTRRNISYDEHMDAPMHSPPPDLTVNILWKDPVIPQHKFRNTAEVLSCLFVLSDPNCFDAVARAKCCLYSLIPKD